MAAEADVPESISVTTQAGDGYVSTGKFDITVDQCSPLQLKKSEGQEDQHPEPVKCFVEGDIAYVESKNGISECGNPLEPLSDPKVGKQETCVAESFQVDESNQAETGIADRENGEKGSEEKEAVEATEKKSEQLESNGIVNAEAVETSRSKINLDEHVQVISDHQDSGDEIPTEKSFAMVYEEKGPEVTSEAKESTEDKLESASVLDDHEERAGLGKEIQEKNILDTPLATQTEDIIEESPKEVKNQYETVEETPEASGTASEAVKEDENAECQVEIPCVKHEEDTLKKGEALDTGEDSVAKEEDSEGFSAVEHIKTNSTDREEEGETNLKDFLLARSNLNSVEDEAATSRESSETIITAEDERQVVNVEQNREEEGKAEKAITSSDTIEDETPDEQNLPAASILMRTVTESESAEVSESTISEPNENVERSEEVLNVSTVKCDEDDQGDRTNPTKDDKDVETFTAKAAEDDDYTSPVTITETRATVTPNDEESSPQTLQECDSGEELQHLRDVMPEETKTETPWENAEEITCTKEETTTQNTQESLDEEKKEATENTNNLDDDNARDKVLETAGTEQETGEHVVREIHTLAEPPQDFVDKETNEETSTEYQACTDAADLSTTAEEKNLEEHAIQELSSPLVVEEATNEIPKEEETYTTLTTLLEEEEKEGHATCNEATEEYAAGIEKNIQEKDGTTPSNSESVSGELSHVTILKESETKIEMQDKDMDTVPEERGRATILANETTLEVEDIDVQLKKNFESKENLEEQFPIAADEGEIFLKEAEAENKEQIKNADIAHEDVDVQAEKTVNSEEDIDKQIPPIADEGETSLKEAEAEIKEQVAYADIVPEDKGLAAILTDETPLEAEDTGVQAEESFESKEKFKEKNPIPTDEDETFLKEAEVENKEQIKYSDIAPEDKGLATILTGEANSDTKEFSDEQIPTAVDEGERKIAHGNVVLNDTPGVQILEEAEPEVGVEEESCKSEDQPEKTNTIVEEAFDEPKITGRDFNKEEIVEGNVACFAQESIEEDTVNKYQENENEKKKLKEEGSCIESLKEGNGEYIREDESETFKDDEKDAVKSGGEILKEPQTGVDESITCETTTIAERSEEIVSTSPVKYEEDEQGESSSPASKEEGSNEDTFSIKVAEEGNGDNGAVTVTETSANVNGKEGLPQAVQEYEPVEGHEKLLDEMPEESKTESSSKKAEVVTCTKEEETTPMNDTKENETEVEEVFEIASMEQETGEHATREIHTVEDNSQEFHDKETTVENLNEHQVSSEAADSSTDFVGNNSDEQASRELSSSLVGDDTSNESSKQEENYISSLKEEENEVNVECKEPVEGANTTHETKFETLEDSIEPKEDLYAHISEEETHTEESSKVVNSLQSEVSEKDVCTDLEGAEAETKEQVKDIEIDHEEKGLTTILTDGAALENVNSEVFPENQIPRVADGGECNTELAGDKAAEESLQVRRLEEAEPKLRVEDESRESEDHPKNKNMIVEEPQLLEQVLDEPNSADGDFSEGQTTEGNAAICAPEIIQEETAKNSQDSDKETENLQKEGSGIESVKAYNTTDLSREFTPEDGSKKFDDNKQDTVKFEGEILKEPEIDGVGESTTYETNQIVETSEEILDASPVKYEEGQPGEGSSQDSAKASKEEDVSEVDDRNGAVTVTESSPVVTSKEEEDSAEASEKYEPEEEKVPVKISDVADAKEVCNLEDKASFAEKTTEETSLQKEGHAEVSELSPEKLDVDATEEEFKEASEIVPECDSRSIDVVSKDEIITSQTLDKGILQKQVEIPSCTLLTEEKEIEASQHEHGTPTKDKNIQEEPEKEVPADGNVGDLFAVRSEDKTPLQKEESEELKASELALEKLDAGDTEKEFKETFKTISIPDSQSTDPVSKDEIVADQTHFEESYALIPKEEELRTYQDDRETKTQDKSIEEEYAKEAEVPADENGRDLVAATLAEETLLQKEEPRELKVSELAPKNLDAGETEETKEPFEKVSKSDSQSAEVVSGDETTEMKISQCVHEATTQDKNKEDESTEKNEVPDGNTSGIFFAATSEEETRLQMEEPREFKACGLAPEKLDAGETEEEIKETLETISKSDSQSIDTVSKDNIVADQTLVEASYTSLPEEKEYKAGESEVPAAENGGDLISARSVEETILKKEEPGELKVSELAPEELNAGETEEEIKKTPETVSEPDSPSTDVVSRDEAISDQTLHEGISTEKLQIPSSIMLPEEKEIKASEEHRTTFCDKNIEENASNLQMQVDENVKATSLLKEEPRQLKASDFELQLKAEVPGKSSNEEIKEDEKLPEESEPYYVREESHDENKAKAEKQGEQIDETSTIKTNEHQNELSEVDEKGIASYKYERQLTFEGLSIKENDPRFIEDKTTHDGFPEEEKRVEEADFEFGLKNQGDEINSKSSIASTQREKDSSTEVSCKAPIVETSQGIESNESGKVISIESGTVSLPNLVPESTKETATACKELKTEEDEEEEHENSEQVKTDEEKGENEHKNLEAGYESPIMVEASRDADVNVKVVSHKKSNNILSGIKHSMSKVKKAIIGKSSHPKTHSEK
nr:putative surface protein SACOL0050 isoform X2 [Malus domestica]